MSQFIISLTSPRTHKFLFLGKLTSYSPYCSTSLFTSPRICSTTSSGESIFTCSPSENTQPKNCLLTCTSTFTVNGSSLEDLIAEGGDYAKYADYVSDGYYHESELASAPSFDIIIDGITSVTN